MQNLEPYQPVMPIMNDAPLGKALIVDDEATNRLLLKSLLKKQGYETLEASNGQEAIDRFKLEQPGIVFMDVMMPEVDGYEATRQIKAESADRFIPVIFLTAMSDQESLNQCIEAGGDDILIKPYDNFVLQSKIRAMHRISMLHRQVQGMYSRLHREQELAESLFINATQGANLYNPCIKSSIRPASTFSGDMILSAYSPSRDLFYLIGDFTGHGLTAALGALPVSEVFRAMVSKGFDAEDILAAINKKLKSLLPVGMFLGVQLVVVYHDLEHARIFNAGMPDILVIDGLNHSIRQRLNSRGLPLGVVETIEPKEIVQYVPIKPNDRILMYSDGLTEARNQEDQAFGEQRLQQAIGNASANSPFDQIFTDLDNFCGSTTQVDDITLVEITCVHDLLPEVEIGEQAARINKQPLPDRGNWSLSMKFNGARLRESNPVPILMNNIFELEGSEDARQALFTVMTELYVNALDHGVLGLNSSLKSDPTGFASYFQEREEKLGRLNSGFVNFDIAIEQAAGVRNITIQVEDSGEGFDHKNHRPPSNDDLTLSGRGILLLKDLCDSLEYLGKGNVVRAVFSWNIQ